MNNEKPLVSIIAPTRQLKRSKNLRHMLRPVTSLPDLVASIRDNVKLPHELIVVVNDEGDRKLIDYVTKSPDIDKYCLNSCNAGVSRAWNQGRMLAEAESLLYVNDDAVLGPESVERLREALWSAPDVGEVGPKGGRWHRDQSGERTGLERVEEADEISGFCFMLRAEAFDQVGGFDIRYTPAGCEEIDMSFAIRNKGWRCLVVPGLDIRTEPAHGISARDTTIRYLNNSAVNTRELHKRNTALFLSKWYPS